MQKKIAATRNEQRKRQQELDGQYFARRIALAGYSSRQDKVKEQYEKATEALEAYSNCCIHILFDQNEAD